MGDLQPPSLKHEAMIQELERAGYTVIGGMTPDERARYYLTEAAKTLISSYPPKDWGKMAGLMIEFVNQLDQLTDRGVFEPIARELQRHVDGLVSTAMHKELKGSIKFQSPKRVWEFVPDHTEMPHGHHLVAIPGTTVRLRIIESTLRDNILGKRHPVICIEIGSSTEPDHLRKALPRLWAIIRPLRKVLKQLSGPWFFGREYYLGWLYALRDEHTANQAAEKANERIVEYMTRYLAHEDQGDMSSDAMLGRIRADGLLKAVKPGKNKNAAEREREVLLTLIAENIREQYPPFFGCEEGKITTQNVRDRWKDWEKEYGDWLKR